MFSAPCQVLSSMEAHATNPTWAILDLTPRVWARCRSGTGSRSAPEADPLASREGLGGVQGVEQVPVINLTGSPSGQALPKEKGLLKKSRVKPNAE